MTTETTDIQITAAGDEPGARSLKVEVPVPLVQAAEKKAASYYAKRARLPGFRPGKAPIEVVRRRFGDAIKEAVLRELIGESWKAAIARNDLKPIAEPHIHHLKFEDGSPLTFEFHVEVKPDLRLERVGGFALTRRAPPVTDEMVDGQIDQVRRQKAPWVPVETGRPTAGQLVQVSLATLKDGEAQETKPYQLVLGEGRALPAVEERIMELTVGETADAVIRFPDDFPDEAKRGTSSSVRITLHEIKKQELPELTDSFAAELGDFDSIAALRRAVREDLELEAAREADADLRRQVVEQIVAANGVVAPRPLVERALGAFAQAYKIPEDQHARFAQEFGPIAENQVRRDLVLDALAEREKLKATEAELDERVAEVARRRKLEPGQVYASLQKADRLRELERNITEEKVFAYLLGQSTVTDA